MNTIQQEKEAKQLSRAQAYSIGELMLFHQLRYVAGKRISASHTKKGPGRRHLQGKQ